LGQLRSQISRPDIAESVYDGILPSFTDYGFNAKIGR
jgi:hypothetical protein